MKKSAELTPIEKWNNLTFADNFIFCKVMADNPDVCKELLELLLEIKIDRIEMPVSEKTLKTDFDSRGVRFDVYVKDGTGRSFDIEIQTTHSTTLAKRARYYQGLIDVDNVQSGKPYETLKETYVIFLCLGDAFGKSLPKYTFRYTCKENPALEMNDGSTNVFFNAKLYDKMNSQALKSFFKFLCGQEPTSDFTDKLSALVERTKLNAQWRHRFMFWEEEMREQSKILAEQLAPEMAKDLAQDLAKDMAQNLAKDMAKDLAQDMVQNLAKDMAKGMAQNMTNQELKKEKLETAKKFLEMNLSPEQVSKGTNLPLKQVLELQNEMQTKKI